MKYMLDLLMTSPDAQVRRCQLAHKAIAEGRWTDAAFFLRNAAREEQNEWGEYARDLAELCRDQVQP